MEQMKNQALIVDLKAALLTAREGEAVQAEAMTDRIRERSYEVDLRLAGYMIAPPVARLTGFCAAWTLITASRSPCMRSKSWSVWYNSFHLSPTPRECDLSVKAFCHKPESPGLWQNAHTMDTSGSVSPLPCLRLMA